MFNATGFTKQYNGPNDTQGETNGAYAAMTQNDYSASLSAFDPNSDTADTTIPAGIDVATIYQPAPDAPNNSGGGFSIGGFLSGITTLGSAITQTSANIASDVRQTRANLNAMNQPATFADQFNAMPLMEKLVLGVAAFFVVRFALHKFV